MAKRKEMNYILASGSVTVQRLHYPDGIDGDAQVAEEKVFEVGVIPAELPVGEDGTVSLAAYGLSQILQDRASAFSSEEKMAKMDEVFAMLQEGQWKAQRASTGGGAKKATIPATFAEGFARFLQSKGKEMDASTATIYLQGLDNEERKALRAHADIKAFVQQVQEEAEAKAGDLDLADLLG